MLEPDATTVYGGVSSHGSFADLVEGARLGDDQAVNELVRRYEPEIRRFVRVRLTDWRLRRSFDSQDICQSVLCRFFARLGDGGFQLHEPRQLVGLLLTMARNKLRDEVRKHRTVRRGGNNAQHGIEEKTLEYLVDREREPGQQVADAEIVALVLHELPSQDQYLAGEWMRGRQWEELAVELNSTAEALRKRLSRALQRVARAKDWSDNRDA